MPDVLRLLTYANRREVARALRDKGYKTSGETLNRWVRDRREIPLEMREAILRLFGLPVGAEEPRPEWAGALVTDMETIRADVAATVAQLGALKAMLEAIQAGLLPPGDDPVDDPLSPGPVRKRGR